MIRSLDLVKKRSWDIPKRYLQITLYDAREGGYQSKKVLSELGIEAKVLFSTQSTVFGMVPQATIVITGLTRDKMSFLSTSYQYWTEHPIFNRIVIDGGYEGQHGILFDGNITECIPNLDNADYNITLKCVSMYNTFNNAIASVNVNGLATVNEIARKIASKMINSKGETGGIVVVSSISDEYKVADFNMPETSPINQMRHLASMSGVNIYVENDRMYIKENDAPHNGIGTFNIDPSMIVGTVVPTDKGCVVKIRMNPYVACGMNVNLKTYRFPLINGNKYWLASYNHTGDTKGRNWITTLELTRMNMYGAGSKEQNT